MYIYTYISYVCMFIVLVMIILIVIVIVKGARLGPLDHPAADQRSRKSLEGTEGVIECTTV